MVSIEQAAERLPPRDRAELIRQFNTRPRAPADRVVITRDAITSETGYAAYSPLMSRMNHGRGRICESVTRDKWKSTDQQYAIVFKVNGQFYGYAAVCGNLFELYGNEIPPAKPPPAAAVPPDVPAAGAPPLGDTPSQPPGYTPPAALAPPPPAPPGDDTFAGGAGVPPDVPGFPPFGGGGWVYVPGPVVFVPQVPVTPIPEPSTWLLMLGGLLGLCLQRARR